MILSFVMPFYGDVDYFKKSVRSVIAQDDPDWNLLIIDDCYPSSVPRNFIEELEDDRILFISNESNIGISANFQKSISLSSTEFTAIIGCDDELLPNYVSHLKYLIEKYPSVSYIQTGVEVIDAQGNSVLPLADRAKKFLRSRHRPTEVIVGQTLASSLLRGNWTYFPSICWNTSVIKKYGFSQHYQIVLDLALQLDIAFHGGSMLLDLTPTFRYRRHEKSASSWASSDSTRFDEEKDLFINAAKEARALGWLKASKLADRHILSRLNALTTVPRAIKAHDSPSARKLLRYSLVPLGRL